MTGLAELCAQALGREAAQPAIEFEGRWLNWGDMRRVADRLQALIDACGAGPSAAVAFAPRNRPSAVAALIGLVAASRTIKMIYAFQSGAGIARDIERLEPAIVVVPDLGSAANQSGGGRRLAPPPLGQRRTRMYVVSRVAVGQ